MRRIFEDNFEEWNEEMIKKYGPSTLNYPNAIVRYIEEKRVKVLLKLLAPQMNDVILEIGCGYGEILRNIHGGKLYGVDLSDTAVSKSRDVMKKRAVILKANAESLPFPDQSFTKVYCSEVLEHLLHPAKALEEATRVLKKDGVLVVTIPNESLIDRIKASLVKFGLFGVFLKGRSLKMTDEWHLHSFNMSYLKKHLPNSLGVEAVRSIPFLLLPLRYVVKLQPRRAEV